MPFIRNKWLLQQVVAPDYRGRISPADDTEHCQVPTVFPACSITVVGPVVVKTFICKPVIVGAVFASSEGRDRATQMHHRFIIVGYRPGGV